jgi:hypothetical protein
MPNANPTPERLELGLSRIFALCDRNRAAWLKAREDAKISRSRLWYRDGETETENHKTR